MLDTRRAIKVIMGSLEFESPRSLTKGILCGVLALGVAYLPPWPDLSSGAQATLFILLFAAGLWMTEAIPAFAVALLVIGLEIAILGRPGGVFAETDTDWQMFIEPWSSPLIWLFLGGFVLAHGAEKTGLDRWIASHVITRLGTRPGAVLLSTMAVTFTFSMFMSNTATTSMMMAVMMPVVGSMRRDPFAKALLLGVPFAANIGGMGTIIGTPPNAIAAGMLESHQPIDFARWMIIGVPPALVLAAVMWGFLMLRYRSTEESLDLSSIVGGPPVGSLLPLWRRLIVMAVFVVTVGLWLTSSLHPIPTYVVSFIPICAFATVVIIGPEDMRQLPWDILLLITGGLSLGVAVSETGLADWIVSHLPFGAASGIVLALALGLFAAVLSNFMSNTAAANILIPLAIALGSASPALMAVAVALGASSAMCLPISTPPNAIAYSAGQLQAKDFLVGGVIVAILGPVLAILWCSVVL
ncbi:MAG: DASS family sodium-coupled anion symporter [Armatimonadia bacterium]|nr:DASS family sodium-coupled anion symporter [Armatimonadia bacterium]